MLRKNICQEQRKGGKMEDDLLGPYTIVNIEDKSADLQKYIYLRRSISIISKNMCNPSQEFQLNGLLPPRLVQHCLSPPHLLQHCLSPPHLLQQAPCLQTSSLLSVNCRMHSPQRNVSISFIANYFEQQHTESHLHTCRTLSFASGLG